MTVTFCFTPEHRGLWPHHSAPPQEPAEFAEFCGAMTRRYAPGRADAFLAAPRHAETADAFEQAAATSGE